MSSIEPLCGNCKHGLNWHTSPSGACQQPIGMPLTCPSPTPWCPCDEFVALAVPTTTVNKIGFCACGHHDSWHMNDRCNVGASGETPCQCDQFTGARSPNFPPNYVDADVDDSVVYVRGGGGWGWGYGAGDPCRYCDEPWQAHTSDGRACLVFLGRVPNEMLSSALVAAHKCERCARYHRPFITAAGWCSCRDERTMVPLMPAEPAIDVAAVHPDENWRRVCGCGHHFNYHREIGGCHGRDGLPSGHVAASVPYCPCMAFDDGRPIDEWISDDDNVDASLTDIQRRIVNDDRRVAYLKGVWTPVVPLTADDVLSDGHWSWPSAAVCVVCGEPWAQHTANGPGCGGFVGRVSADRYHEPSYRCGACNLLKNELFTLAGRCKCPTATAIVPPVDDGADETAIADAVPCKGCGCARVKHETAGCTGAGCGCGGFDDVTLVPSAANPQKGLVNAYGTSTWGGSVGINVSDNAVKSALAAIPARPWSWRSEEDDLALEERRKATGYLPAEPLDPKELAEAVEAGFRSDYVWQSGLMGNVGAVARLRARRNQDAKGLGQLGASIFDGERAAMNTEHIAGAYRAAHGIGWGGTKIGGALRVAGVAIERGSAPVASAPPPVSPVAPVPCDTMCTYTHARLHHTKEGICTFNRAVDGYISCECCAFAEAPPVEPALCAECGHTRATHGDGLACRVRGILPCACPTFFETAASKAPANTVNHPSHYGGDTTYECIKVLEAWGLAVPFCLGNAIKYIARAGKKDPATTVEDLKKSVWYTTWVINKLERDQGEEE